MMNLSGEDLSGWKVTPESTDATLQHLTPYPDKGSILVFQQSSAITGYAILFNFWSNGYKGNILIIDELYVLPEFRSKGISTAFINYLYDTKYNNSVMLLLEVSATNIRAEQLYRKMGFQLNEYNTLKKRIN